MIGEALAVGQFVARAVAGVLPAFVLSVAFGVLIRALKLDSMIRRAVGARVGLAVVLATAVGAFSPLCSCTVIPVVSGLLLSGVPLAPVMAFWVASPTMDPEMFALTVATLGWPLAIVRLGATLVLSLAAGYVTLALQRGGVLTADVLRPALLRPAGGPGRLPFLAVVQPVIAGASDARSATACCGPAAAPPVFAAASWTSVIGARLRAIHWPGFARQMATDGYRLGRWLVLAFVLEAVMLRYVPQATIAGVLGNGNAFAVGLAALVGIPLYLNNVSALPIVSGLLAQGMQPGAAIAFLIAGPVTTVPAMSAVWGIVRPRVFALYLGVALVGAVVLGALTNVLLG
ncbi:MAG: permease [Candidatus Rokubacteria bacterium]|nr:permease [Candidatus Rokubacteria bacterium]